MEETLMTGALYVIGTPIGNLQDITLRALEALRAVPLVAAEDTRHTRKLLTHFGIQTRLMSYHEHNERKRAPELVGVLLAGEDVALVTDAGTPALSDPGAHLVRMARDAGVSVHPVPGISAITTGLSVAAMPADTFLFAGFLPARGPARRRSLVALGQEPHTLVLFEAPHRLLATLEDAEAVLGNREAFLAREMTKVHETFLTGQLSTLAQKLKGEKVRGEITLLIAGAAAETRQGLSGTREPGQLKPVLRALVAGRPLSIKEAAGLLARFSGMPRSEVYALALETRRQMDQNSRDEG